MDRDSVEIQVKDRWLMLCHLSNRWMIRCNRFGKKRVVSDSGRDQAQENDAEGYVRIRPKRDWDLENILSP